MKWLRVPENTRVKVNSNFKKLIFREKGNKNWEQFERQIDISKWTIQNYLGIKYRYKPDIKTLKKVVENSSITAEEIQDSIVWTEKLELLSIPVPKIEDVIILKGKKQFFDVEKFCNGLKSTGGNKVLFFPYKTMQIDDRFIEVYYETGPGQFKAKKLKAPKMLELNEEMFTVFGLIQAEVAKSLRSTMFQFSNSELVDVKKVLEYFTNTWKIPKERWVVEVCYWKPDFDEKKKIIENFWKTELGIEKIIVREGTEYRLSKKAKKYGVASLRLYNKVFSNLVLSILNKIIKPLVETNLTYCSWYLTGLFEGDGTLSRNNEKFSFIGLAFNPKSNELDHYEKVLNLVNIKFDKQHLRDVNRRCIFIQHWKDFLKILKITNGQLFLDKRNRIFIKGVLNNQYVKSLLRLKFLKDKQPITTDIYAKEFNVVRRTALKCLKKLENLKLIEKKLNHKPFKYIVTKDGLEFLNLIDKLENIIGE